jgi:XRE family transcriptional regulator, aerobic/anaerobic benzoate catabolism transcriptional regulator
VARSTRVALVGLRGAGKSTLGAMLAEDLGFPFVELSREIEKFAGCSVSEIQGLYGQNAYRRYERRALEEAIQIYPEAVIATPGGIVSDPATFNLLLAHCTTVWLKADARRPHEARHRPGRPAPDGGQPRGDGRPEGHPGRPRRLLFEGRAARRHQRAAAGATFQAAAQAVREALQLPGR